MCERFRLAVRAYSDTDFTPTALRLLALVAKLTEGGELYRLSEAETRERLRSRRTQRPAGRTAVRFAWDQLEAIGVVELARAHSPGRPNAWRWSGPVSEAEADAKRGGSGRGSLCGHTRAQKRAIKRANTRAQKRASRGTMGASAIASSASAPSSNGGPLPPGAAADGSRWGGELADELVLAGLGEALPTLTNFPAELVRSQLDLAREKAKRRRGWEPTPGWIVAACRDDYAGSARTAKDQAAELRQAKADAQAERQRERERAADEARQRAADAAAHNRAAWEQERARLLQAEAEAKRADDAQAEADAELFAAFAELPEHERAELVAEATGQLDELSARVLARRIEVGARAAAPALRSAMDRLNPAPRVADAVPNGSALVPLGAA